MITAMVVPPTVIHSAWEGDAVEGAVSTALVDSTAGQDSVEAVDSATVVNVDNR